MKFKFSPIFDLRYKRNNFKLENLICDKVVGFSDFGELFIHHIFINAFWCSNYRYKRAPVKIMNGMGCSSILIKAEGLFWKNCFSEDQNYGLIENPRSFLKRFFDQEAWSAD